MSETASDCVFCKIGAKEVPADIVHVTDHVVAFRDINPQAPVHILIIPTDHVESATSMKADVLGEIFAAAEHLAKAEGIDQSGWRLVTNVGSDAGQTFAHLHFHLLGGRRMGWPPG
jgi:histidine triad (HIT) family protein